MSGIEGLGRVRRVEFEQPQEVAPKVNLKLNNEETIANGNSKRLELGFTGSVIAANFLTGNGRPTPVNGNFQASGGGVSTSYRVGDATRPPIRHDNGFRQNPNDPTDTTLRPTIPPTQRDRDFYNDQLFQARAAQVAENLPVPFTDRDNEARRLEDGIDAYLHFLQGNGANRNFSYDEFVSEDTAGRTILNNAIRDTQRGVEQIYNQIVANNPELANKPITFNVTSGAITVGAGNQFPYPATENWQKAIGGHSIWNSASVTVTPPATQGGRPTFSMNYTLHAEDRYNFNPGQHDIATGAPDSLRGRLEMTGLAHQYDQFATLNRRVTWSQGDISNSTRVTNGGR